MCNIRISVIDPSLGAEYFEMLRAPEKELIWFEKSAHGAPFEEPENSMKWFDRQPCVWVY